MKTTQIASRVALFAVVGASLASALLYRRLPTPMPIHFDLTGHADGWSSRDVGAFLLPVSAALVWMGSRFSKNAARSVTLSATAVFLCALHVLVLRAALDGSMRLGGGFALLLGAFDVGLGLLFPRLRRNRWVGIRLPWTLTSDEIWARTHRFGGAVFVAGGIVTLLGAMVLGDVSTPFAIVVMLVGIGVITVESYRLSRHAG